MRITRIANMLLGMGLLLATSAFAADKGGMKLFDPVSVSGKQLPAGEYSVTWVGNGPAVAVKIMKGNKLVATAQARVVDLKRVPDNDGTTTKAHDGQSLALTEIFFRGKSQALVLDSDAVEVAGQK